jgi:hypothetical protein
MPIENKSNSIFQIKITLTRTDKPIWRRILVPSNLNLERLHDAIQISMGWNFAHLFEFTVGDRRYGEPDPYAIAGEQVFHAKNLKLSSIFDRGIQKFSYLYDFGDHWEHEILIEKQVESKDQRRYPVLVHGERRCPPEDVGGIDGFEEFLNAIQDSNHEDHQHFLDWAGDDYDPNDIDLDRLNLGLEMMANRLRSRPRKTTH